MMKVTKFCDCYDRSISQDLTLNRALVQTRIGNEVGWALPNGGSANGESSGQRHIPQFRHSRFPIPELGFSSEWIALGLSFREPKHCTVITGPALLRLRARK
jgi:hypothetical protein